MTLARRDLTNRFGLFHFLALCLQCTDAGLLLRFTALVTPQTSVTIAEATAPQSLQAPSEIESVLTGGAPEPPGSLTCFLLLTS
jgi:hypothetical protein